MVSEEERLKREIRIVKEIIALREKRDDIGWNNWMEMEQKTLIPPSYSHLLDQRTDVLEEHLQRLQEDLNDWQNLNDEDHRGFREEAEYRRGKRREDEECEDS
jgi:hypothetical protein